MNILYRRLSSKVFGKLEQTMTAALALFMPWGYHCEIHRIKKDEQKSKTLYDRGDLYHDSSFRNLAN